MDIISRLNRYLDTMNISSTRFADLCDIPRPSASQLLNGRNKKVSNEILEKIHSSFPDLSMQWLIFGEGNPRAPLPGFNNAATRDTAAIEYSTSSVPTSHNQNQTNNVTAPESPQLDAAGQTASAAKPAEEHNTPTPSYKPANEAISPEPQSEQIPRGSYHTPGPRQPYTQHDNSTIPKTIQTSHAMAQEEEDAPYYRVIKNNDSKSVTSIIVVYSNGTTATFVPK